MDLVQSVQEWLKGKKTYLIALIAVVLNVGVHYKWWTVDDVNYWNTVLAGLGLAALRAGVTNSLTLRK